MPGSLVIGFGGPAPGVARTREAPSGQPMFPHLSAQKYSGVANISQAGRWIWSILNGNPSAEVNTTQDGKNPVIVIQSLTDHAVLENWGVPKHRMAINFPEIC